MKRFLSLLLVLCMMTSLMAVGAWAEDGVKDPPPHEHNWSTTDSAPATCDSNGYVNYSCTCGDSYTETLGAIPHNWVAGETVAATCTADGYVNYSCACGESYTETLGAAGHNWIAGETVAATCTEDGYVNYSCACGDKYTETLAATDHSWSVVDSTAPTCTAAGSESFECACGEKKTETLKATGHQWNGGELTKEPNCTEWGVMLYTCTVCEATKTVDDEVLPKGHQWNGGELTKEATIYADGVMTYTCTVCKDTATDTIPQILCKDCKKFCDAENPNTACEVCAKDASLCKGEKMAKSAAPKTVYDLAKDGDFYIGDAAGNIGNSHTYNGVGISSKTTGIHSRGNLNLFSDWNLDRPSEEMMNNVGKYAFVITGAGNYAGQTVTLYYTVKPCKLTPTSSITPSEFTFDGTAKIPEFTISGQGVTLSKDKDYNVEISDNVNAGTASYTITPKDGSNYTFDTITGTFTINKADPAVTLPTAKGGLKYNGESQTLINAGSTKDGTISYSLSKNGTYSTSLPYATEAGTYNVWYKVTGDKNHKDIDPACINVTIAELKAEDISALIKGLGWLPNGQVDPGNKHQRNEVLKVWNMYNLLSAKEQARVPAKQFNWLYYLVSNTDYSIINGSGSYWYQGKKGGLNFTAIDPTHNFVGVYVDGYLISSSNYSAWWTGDNQYDEDDLVVVSLKQSYLETLKLGKHRISIVFDNGYAPGHFYVVEASASPRTGDTANIPLWSGLMLISAATLAAAGFMLKKKKEN